MTILVLGADGFIGRHIAFHLRETGQTVIAHARNPARLKAMGFRTIAADLNDPSCHLAAFWTAQVGTPFDLVNAAGLLTGSDSAFEAVHCKAPQAAYAAARRSVLLSAVGIEADSPFSRWRRQGEAVAQAADAVILRAGLVLGDTSYGGSSLIRALAAMPFISPVVGDGSQRFNPIHARDLAEVVAACLAKPPPRRIWQIGGPQMITQANLIAQTRCWLGLPARPFLALPYGLAHALGRLGDWLRLGPISATSVTQLGQGIAADPAPLLQHITPRPRGISAFLAARPAGTQDLWQARLYLVKPLIRLALALMWLASAALGLLLPAQDFLTDVAASPAPVTLILARGGGLVDLALGLALLRNWRPKMIGLLQIAVVLGYTLGLSLIAPALWLDPFGGLLKNLPIFVLLLTHLILIEER